MNYRAHKQHNRTIKEYFKYGQCPINSYCTAYQKNLTAEIPVRIKKVKRRKEEKSVFLFLTNENEIAIEKRTEKGLLSGMYQLPNIDGYYSEKELKMILQQWQIKPSQIDFLKEVKHIFTHIDWCMKGYLVITDSKSDRFIWVSLQELSEKYPLPTAFQKFIKALPDETERKRNK